VTRLLAERPRFNFKQEQGREFFYNFATLFRPTMGAHPASYPVGFLRGKMAKG